MEEVKMTDEEIIKQYNQRTTEIGAKILEFMIQADTDEEFRKTRGIDAIASFVLMAANMFIDEELITHIDEYISKVTASNAEAGVALRTYRDGLLKATHAFYLYDKALRKERQSSPDLN